VRISKRACRTSLRSGRVTRSSSWAAPPIGLPRHGHVVAGPGKTRAGRRRSWAGVRSRAASSPLGSPARRRRVKRCARAEQSHQDILPRAAARCPPPRPPR
jgi:hypothetical protein